MRTALFCGIMHSEQWLFLVDISAQRKFPSSKDRDLKVDTKLWQGITTICCIMTQKSTVLIYFKLEA
jgi:hypothetical protein